MTDHPGQTAIQKVVATVDEAVAVVRDGDVVMFGGFGGAGFPFALRDALSRTKVKDLTLIGNNADFGCLAEIDCIRRLICSYPSGPTSKPVLERIEAGEIELLVTPQGTLAEQIRAAGAGLGGVLTPTGLGTELAARWEAIERGGKQYLLVPPLRANVAFIKATVADTIGNLFLRAASKNFNPLMAMAADLTIVEAETIVEPGGIDPDHVHVPSVFVSKVVQADRYVEPVSR